MAQDTLSIEDITGDDHRILRLNGPLLLATFFEFQSLLRANRSRSLIVDLSGVPYIDSAGIGALVGAYVTHQKDARHLALVGVTKRVHDALTVTRVEQFFRFFDTIGAAEQASAAE
jgi:anti-sigma B factor antagonist